MHGILGFARLGLKQTEAANLPALRDHFNEIEESGQRLMMLINKLLDISKLESDKNSLQFVSCSIEDLTVTVIKSLQTLLDTKKLTVAIDALVSFPIECDGSKIRQVLTNLLSNAIKFSRENTGIIIRIESPVMSESSNLDTQNPRANIMVSVLDHGVGVPENELEKIFDKFAQSKKTKTGAGGTGLGLAICKEIIQQHSGRIWCENLPEGGAIFIFTIPIASLKE